MLKKTKEKQKAISLRKAGRSYSEIGKSISISKATLSLWLRKIRLTPSQTKRLLRKGDVGRAAGAMKVRSMRIEKDKYIREKAREEAKQLIKDHLWLTGVILYWAEGSKEKVWRTGEKLAFTNMDLEMHRLFLRWLKKFLKVADNRIRFEIYIHRNSNIIRAKEFWSKKLNIPTETIRVYFKKSNQKSIRKNYQESYNGVLRIWVTKGTDLNRKVAGWIEGVIKYVGK